MCRVYFHTEVVNIAQQKKTQKHFSSINFFEGENG